MSCTFYNSIGGWDNGITGTVFLRITNVIFNNTIGKEWTNRIVCYDNRIIIQTILACSEPKNTEAEEHTNP